VLGKLGVRSEEAGVKREVLGALALGALVLREGRGLVGLVCVFVFMGCPYNQKVKEWPPRMAKAHWEGKPQRTAASA
jgi:hypothetical protein